MTTVRWGAYELPVVLVNASVLAGLANTGISAPGDDIINTGGSLYCDVEFVTVSAFSPSANAMLDVWVLRSIDGGVSFEDGASGFIPSRDPDITIPVRGGTSIIIRAGASQLVLPPGHFKAMARNRLGASIPSGSTVRIASYTEIAF